MRAALFLILAGCHSGLPGGATLTGRVVVGGESELAGIAVRAEGAESRTTTTDADGRYRFDLSFGDYRLSAAVRSTVEATRALSVTLDRTLEAPDLSFTPAGGFTGRATRGGRTQGNAGILVSVDGTGAIGVTDDAGGYHIDRVPVGSYTVRAQVEGFRGGSVDSQLVRWGEVTQVPDLDLVIAPGHASLRGTTLLFGRSEHAGTKVEVVGTGLVATTASDGSWAIQGVPEGTWALHFVNGVFEDTVSQVEALVGSDGFVIDEALYPLPQSPFTLFNARRLATVQSVQTFTLSPDGTRFLYLDFGKGLQSVGLDGTVTNLFATPFWPGDYAQFSPDGQRVVLVNTNKLYGVPAAGGTPMLLLDGPRGFLFSPDSAQLAYFEPDPVSGERSFGVIPASGGAPKQLVSDPNLFSVRWNATSTRLLTYDNLYPGSIRLIASDGTAILTQEAGSSPLLRPDARWAIVTVNGSGALVAVDLEAGTATTVAPAATALYGFAGDRAVYKNAGALYSVPLTGGMAATLGAIADYGQTRISGDGSTVAFTSDCDNQVCKLWKIPAAGGTAELIAMQQSYFNPSNNGGRVLYTTDGNSGSYSTLWVGGDGQPPRQIDSGVYTWGSRFTPDGSHVLYYKDLTQWGGGQIGTLYIAPSAGGTPVELAESVYVDPSAALDGQHLALETHPPSGAANLLLAPADGGPAVPILDGLVEAEWTAKGAVVAIRGGAAAPYRFQNGFYVAQP